MVLLLYPNKGTTATKTGKERKRAPCNELFDTLDADTIKVYVEVFVNNNQDLIAKFLSDPFIQDLWNLTF
jgi:hypothetical protein